MLRRMSAAAVALLVLGGFVLAETFRGTVDKIEEGSITIKVRKRGEKETTEKTIKTNKDTEYKVTSGRGGKGKKAKVEDSTAKDFKAAWEKNKTGTFVSVETNDDGVAKTVTYGTGGGGKGKGKGKKKKSDD